MSPIAYIGSIRRIVLVVVLLAPAFPARSAPDEFVSLRAQACGGSCYYEIRAFADDRYELRILRVHDSGSPFEEGSLWNGAYRSLTERIARARFDRFRDRYDDGDVCDRFQTDQPETVIAVASEGRSKTVVHDHGCLDFPRRSDLVELENDLALMLDAGNRARQLDERAKATADVAAVLARAVVVELLSLDSSEGRDRHWETMCQGWCFHDWPVLGTTRLTEPGEVATVREELGRWLAAPEPEAVALCFSPRHGVRVREGEHVYDFVVCYECGELDLHVDFSDDAVQKFRAGDQGLLDALFRAHDVPYRPRRDHQ